MLFVAVILYALAIIAANLSIAHFGPSSAPINAFLFIGLDLTLRDWLHVRIPKRHMLALIVATGALTFGLNPAAGQIAVASACAFSLAALADWLVFSYMRGSWLLRANASNMAGAVVDSLVFVAVAALPLVIVPGMIGAKWIGGFVWSFVFSKFRRS